MRSTLEFATYFLLPGVVALALVGAGMAQSSNVSIYATGLNNPRGLTFGPDGILYVPEGGAGGTTSTVGLCTQVPDVCPTGPVIPENGVCMRKVPRERRLGGGVHGLPTDHCLVHPATVEVGANGRNRWLTNVCTSSSGTTLDPPPFTLQRTFHFEDSKASLLSSVAGCVGVGFWPRCGGPPCRALMDSAIRFVFASAVSTLTFTI